MTPIAQFRGLNAIHTSALPLWPHRRVRWNLSGELLAVSGLSTTLLQAKTWVRLQTRPGEADQVTWLGEDSLVRSTRMGEIVCEPITSGPRWRQKGRIPVTALAASPSLTGVAVAVADGYIGMLKAEDGEPVRTHSFGPTRAIAFAPDGLKVALGEVRGRLTTLLPDGELRVLSAQQTVVSLAWFPDSERLAVGCKDQSIQLWDTVSARLLARMEGHTSDIVAMSVSADGQILCSLSTDGRLLLWDLRGGDKIGALVDENFPSDVQFHPTKPVLALAYPDRIVVHELRESFSVLTEASDRTVHYCNAKVVLVGDTGVGKTGLRRALLGHDFIPTESTHGCDVSVLESNRYSIDSDRREYRDVVLWDLAGQPGYRVFHRQHLGDVSVAIVVFDARSETDPFAGVSYWARAIDDSASNLPLTKFLVAARTDRGGVAASGERVKSYLEKYGFKKSFETSAKNGAGIADLVLAVQGSIRWDSLPKLRTPELFYDLKEWILSEREKGATLKRSADLIRERSVEREVFETCVLSLEVSGVLKRLSFGDFILLRPELLDSYSAALAMAARSEPDGLGYIQEGEARSGSFRIEAEDQVDDPESSRLILVATIEDILARGIALMQPTEQGAMMVFPSELRTEMPDYPGQYTRSVVFDFEGDVRAVYATLVVSLCYTAAFKKKELYRNAAVFETPVNGDVCGFAMDYPERDDDGRGRLTVFFDNRVRHQNRTDASRRRDSRILFLRYISTHLSKMAFRGVFARTRCYYCTCGYPEAFPVAAIEWSVKKHEKYVRCPACSIEWPIDDLTSSGAGIAAAVERQISVANAETERATRCASLDERERHSQYDIFLCHNSADKKWVRALDALLRAHGILPWFDEKAIGLGKQFIPELEAVIERIPCVGVVLGPNSVGPWQEQEYFAVFDRYVQERRAGAAPPRIVPIVLPDAKGVRIPTFLKGFSWIDFRKSRRKLRDEALIARLVSGILEAGS